MSDEDLCLVEQVLTRLLNEEVGAPDAQVPANEMLSKLLAEVHVMRETKAHNVNVNELSGADESNATAAAVRAALAAAQAAKAAADSVANSSKLVELVLETARRDQPEVKLTDETETSEKDVVKLVKSVQRQNLVTQLILGFMVIATAVWRYKEISWILRLKKMLTNPLEKVGEIFGGDHQHHHHQHKEEVETKPIQLPHLELPPLFQQKTTEENLTT